MSEERPPEETKGAVLDFVIRVSDPILESKKASNLLIIVFIILAAIPLLGIGFLTTRPLAPASVSPVPIQTASAASVSSITAVFDCTDGKSITAVFSGANVQLSLSDGRSLTLPRALSADGARYANPDETFVFWNVGNTATIQENGTTTYASCVTKS